MTSTAPRMPTATMPRHRTRGSCCRTVCCRTGSPSRSNTHRVNVQTTRPAPTGERKASFAAYLGLRVTWYALVCAAYPAAQRVVSRSCVQERTHAGDERTALAGPQPGDRDRGRALSLG